MMVDMSNVPKVRAAAAKVIRQRNAVHEQATRSAQTARKDLRAARAAAKKVK
jgi:hypothetical protein